MFMKCPASVLATAISVALLLAGCGGGGGSVDNKPMLPLLDNWQRFEAGNPTLRMSSAQIRQAYDSRSKRASHDLTITRFVGPGGESILVGVDPHEHEGFWELPPGSTISFAPVLEHKGVRVAEMKTRVVHEDEDDGQTYLTDIVTYGGWLDHTVFGVAFFAACDVDGPGCSGTSPVYDWGLTGGLTPFGVYPGTTPAGMGPATWTGVMVGMESPRFELPTAGEDADVSAWINAGQPDVYLGEARIRIDDLAAPDVDVSFTNIHNVTEGTRHRDMSWEGLSVENGLFGSTDSDEYIAGMFTGPRHQEVGGEFGRGGIEGGFGAKRR